MGQLYQENDEDEYAIIAFKRAYDIDPYDLDSLLCLGISCTNELAQGEAISHLKNWIKYNPNYMELATRLPEDVLPELELDLVTSCFVDAHHMNPKDSNVALALGVLFFIKRDFHGAARYFEDGIRANPEDHSLWNKYGAAMANSKTFESVNYYENLEAAIKIYNQALELRPNYVRTISNIGLAHRSAGRYAESIPYFLNALLLNPRAIHIWQYVRSSFRQMDRFDLDEKAGKLDPNAFRDEFPLIDPARLPPKKFDGLLDNPIWAKHSSS